MAPCVYEETLLVPVVQVCGKLIHSSLSTDSTRWGAGGWGIGGGNYGEFVYATCHAAGTGNIKRVRNALQTVADADPQLQIGIVHFCDIFSVSDTAI